MSGDRFDAAVVGAGVIGGAAAYFLAKAGLRVCLIDRGDLADGASSACHGFVFLQSKKPGPHLELAMASVEMFPSLGAELGLDIEFERSGGMIIAENEEEYQAVSELVAAQREQGVEVDLLSSEQTRSRQPLLGPHIRGGTFSPLDGHVNPFYLTAGFVRAARRLGARVLLHTEVTALTSAAGRVSGVVTSQGEILADTVVVAAGVHSPRVAAMAGVEVPLKPRRGQVLVTEALPPVVRHLMLCARYLATKHRPELAESENPLYRLGVGFNVEQTRAGTLTLATTREFVGFDKDTTVEGIRWMLANTVRLAPALSEVCVIRSFAGLRPFTPDGMPIIGGTSCDGLLLATGHEGDGLCLSAITGRLIAELVSEGRTSLSLEPFRPDRFASTADRPGN